VHLHPKIPVYKIDFVRDTFLIYKKILLEFFEVFITRIFYEPKRN